MTNQCKPLDRESRIAAFTVELEALLNKHGFEFWFTTWDELPYLLNDAERTKTQTSDGV